MVAVVCCAAMAERRPRPEPVAYVVRMPDPRSHEYEIELRVPALPDRAAPEIVFPAWAPGSYMIRDFSRHIYGLTVTDASGRALAAERIDKQRWRIPSGGRAFVVRYRVFAFEVTVRTSFLDTSHAYWNGTSLFFFVDGETTRPCTVTVHPPRGWRIATALAPSPAASQARRKAAAPGRTSRAGGPSRFQATSYDELVDSPFEIGTHESYTFRVGGVTFELALYGRTNADRGRLVDILRRVVRATGDMFGGFPFRRYLFIVHALPAGSGGLEHRSSVTMDIAGLSFEDEKGYQRFADLAAHEFFHAWNVKRLYDGVLGPFDYTREAYTRLLWFHEGFTDYLANVLMLRAGVIDPDGFLKWIAEDWPKYATRPGRNTTPLTELSFEAWIKQYKPAENYVNSAVSYYEKGLWVAMALDLELRLRTGGHRGLPELFRHLWDEGGRRERVISETDVRVAAAALAGAPLDAFFEKYVHGTEELPLPALWRRAGLTVKEVPPWAEAAGENDPIRRRRAQSWTGVALNAGGGAADRAVIKNVVPASPAYEAGLTYGDEIVALDGDRVSGSSFARRVADHVPGDRVRVAYFRRDRLEQTELTLAASPERKLLLTRAPRPSPLGASVLRGWLGR